MAEFDRYAAEYDAGMQHPVKRLLGRSAEEYMAVKTRWLLRDFARLPGVPAGRPSTGGQMPTRVLDVGCGVGTFLRQLHESHQTCDLKGCDVSAAMVDEARRRWNGAPAIELKLIDQGRLPYASDAFDVVVLCCVLHHVAVEDRAGLVQETARVLTPQGRLYVFEHNPGNPLTRRVIRQTPIDRMSELLFPAEVAALLGSAELEGVKTQYLMFFPPRWPFLSRLEGLLTWCPLGGQYVTSASKSASPIP